MDLPTRAIRAALTLMLCGLAVAVTAGELIFGAETASARRGYALGFYKTSSSSDGNTYTTYVTDLKYDDGDSTVITKTVTKAPDGSETYETETRTIATGKDGTKTVTTSLECGDGDGTDNRSEMPNEWGETGGSAQACSAPIRELKLMATALRRKGFNVTFVRSGKRLVLRSSAGRRAS